MKKPVITEVTDRLDKGPWTLFWDMSSGGSRKEAPFDKIYIQAEIAEAVKVFYAIFGHNPHRVTCTCCGPDYAIDDDDTLSQVSGYHRGCDYDEETKVYIETPRSVPLSEYIGDKHVMVIPSAYFPNKITDNVPTQGYVWQD